MPTTRSVDEVEELKALFNDATVLISTDYRGLSVSAMNRLRGALRKSGAGYRISKNTLTRLAADEVGKPEMKDLIDGPVGWVYSHEDPSTTAKSLVEHIQEARLEMEIRGAILDGAILTRAQLEALAKLPSRDVLLAMLMGQMNAPMRGLVTVMSGPARALAIVLQRIAEMAPSAPADDVAEETVPEAAADEAAPPEAEAEESGSAEAAPEAAAESTEEADSAPEAEAVAEEPTAVDESETSGDASEAEEKPETPETEGGEDEE
ncbi:MAG: 50S ribosomal protein L10 [Chloroflexi bacterium]|nr:50S ribosomal protein L10 [Chloroflexota bacterium]